MLYLHCYRTCWNFHLLMRSWTTSRFLSHYLYLRSALIIKTPRLWHSLRSQFAYSPSLSWLALGVKLLQPKPWWHDCIATLPLVVSQNRQSILRPCRLKEAKINCSPAEGRDLSEHILHMYLKQMLPWAWLLVWGVIVIETLVSLWSFCLVLKKASADSSAICMAKLWFGHSGVCVSVYENLITMAGSVIEPSSIAGQNPNSCWQIILLCFTMRQDK